MSLPNMPPVPDSLKQLKHFLSIAAEHDTRDIVVSYWCRMHAVQQAMRIDKSSPEAKRLLGFLLQWLEQVKNREKDNEAINHDIPAQAHIENYALKLFLFADGQDRAGIFNKNVVKAFYTASMLYSVLETLDGLTEEVLKNQKYAKWKAAYIHNCLKNGETPIAGPVEGEGDDDFENPPQNFPTAGPNIPPTVPNSSYDPAGYLDGPLNAFQPPVMPTVPPTNTYKPPVMPVMPTMPSVPPSASSSGFSQPSYNIPPTLDSLPDAVVDPVVIAKAQKYCKFAGSALNYDDVPTAIINLEKALNLLKTGSED